MSVEASVRTASSEVLMGEIAMRAEVEYESDGLPLTSRREFSRKSDRHRCHANRISD